VVPADATPAFEAAMRDALPHLFDASPSLLYQLVTMVSPVELRKRGVPVYRVVHQPGSFVVTMPNAYHAGFNTGFNCAEAVNFAPPNWIPYGTNIAEKYRASKKPLTMSHDSLLVALTKAAAAVGEESEIIGGRKRAPPPLEGARRGAAELAWRADEERRRLAVCALAVGGDDVQQKRRMNSNAEPGAIDATGVHANTTDCDCAVCNGDLWMSAIVSAAAPGVAVCPEHAEHLLMEHGCAASDLVLLYRHTPEELDELIAAAAARVPGIIEAMAEAKGRRERLQKETMPAVAVGEF
jgi:hypothetical protein